MSKIRDWPSFCHTISEIAEFVRDSEHNIQEFIREDRIPYIVVPDGILIPLGGFQACMLDLYDLTAGRSTGSRAGAGGVGVRRAKPSKGKVSE